MESARDPEPDTAPDRNGFSGKPLVASRSFLWSYVAAIVLAAAAAFLVRIHIVEAYRIPTDFMSPTLLSGDHIFVDKMAYRRWKLFGPSALPARGDIVVFSFPSQPKKDFIKRVIAVPGDQVSIADGAVTVNGAKITSREPSPTGEDEVEESIGGHNYRVSWLKDSAQPRKMPPVQVPAGQVFVLGDNRSQGQDSRNWGFVPAKFMKGRASVIWFSSGKSAKGKGIRWQRIFRRVE
ncbi:MAG: signal peptidase I [Deltaproteobacteria bacterium]|nr:signal peptidase I [Deltaproteobacteria bacterium]